MKDESIELIAERIATAAHAGQKRFGGEPYIIHPARVAGSLKRQGHSAETIAAAWLHDVFEDSDLSARDLLDQGIPLSVVQSVAYLTKGDQTYTEYLEGVEADETARIVKIADMLDNLSDLPTPKQVVKYTDGILKLSR